MSEEPKPQYLDPKCSGITQAGTQCAVPFPMWEGEDGRLWCSPHRGQANAPVVRWSPVEHGEALDPERRCLGRLRGGDRQCPAVSTTFVVVGDEKLRCCSWHKRVFADYGVLQPPARTRKAVPEVEPLPDEDEPSTNGETADAAASVESVMSLRERVERSTEENYREIEGALRAALKGTTKPKGVKCPACGEAFKLLLPDHSSAISASKLLLELVVSRPQPPAPPPPVVWDENTNLNDLSTADVYRLAFPGKEPPPSITYERDDEDEEVA